MMMLLDILLPLSKMTLHKSFEGKPLEEKSKCT